MTDHELQAATDQVMFPEAHPAGQITVSICHDPDRPDVRTAHTIQLRPLPIKHAKILAGYVQRIEAAQAAEGATVLKQLDDIADLFVNIVLHLLSFYGLSGCTREVVETSFSFDDAHAFVRRQMDVQQQNDFLLVGLRGILRIVEYTVRSLDRTIEGRMQEVSQSPPSTRPSAANGELASMN
jgi:hypothetical protein